MDRPKLPRRGSEVNGPGDRPSPYKVRIGFPGPSQAFEVFVNGISGTLKHNWTLVNCNFASEGNFNACWLDALNAAENGEATHFVMLHADTIVWTAQWIDALIDAMDEHKLDLLSVGIAIKDHCGHTSSGVANPDDGFHPYHRIGLDEFTKLPEVFTAADLGYPGGCLLHNNGCWVADLRCPKFYELDQNGELVCMFNFPRKIIRSEAAGINANGKPAFVGLRESEDYYFSRMIHKVGVRSAITRQIQMTHRGLFDWPNFIPMPEPKANGAAKQAEPAAVH